MEASIIQELRLRYGGSYYHLLNGLKREIEYLRPFRESYLAMKEHYNSVRMNLQKLEEYIQNQFEWGYRYSQTEQKNFQELESQMTIQKYNLGKAKLQKENLQQERKLIKQKIDDLCKLIQMKMEQKDQLLLKYKQILTDSENLSSEKSVIGKVNENISMELQVGKVQEQSIEEQKGKIMKIIIELERQNMLIDQEICKIQSANSLNKHTIDQLDAKIRDYSNSFIPDKMIIKEQSQQKRSVLKQELDSKKVKLQMTKNAYQVELLQGDRLNKHINEMLDVSVRVEKDLEYVNAEIQNKIKVEIQRQIIDQEQNQQQIANIIQYIETLEQTNAMMLSQMSEICAEDRNIVDTVFYDKCRILNSVASRVEQVGSIIKQKNSQLILKDVSNMKNSSINSFNNTKASNFTCDSQGENKFYTNVH